VRLDGVAAVEVGEEALVLKPPGAAPVTLRYSDIDDLADDDYTLRLTDFERRSYELGELGTAYGQVLADVRERRNAALQRDLLLTGVELQDTFPGKRLDGATPEPVELRLFEDLLVVVPERGTMWGVPYSFVEDVSWDAEAYRVHVRTDETTHVFGHLAKRSEEFVEELRRLLAALEARTAEILQKLVPGAPAGLARLMRDGRAAHQADVEAVAPGVWPALEAAVVRTPELRETYEWLKAQSPPGMPAVGVKRVGGAAAVDADAVLWFFCPLGEQAIAQEITSEEGHATYLFRSAGDLRRSVARLNRALLLLNFRREPVFASEAELAEDRFARYRVALRKLEHLRFAREQFLARAIHNESWREQVEEALARA
jgi:hypothetical protein